MFRLLKNRRGQGLIEYLVIVAIMAVGTMAIIRVLNQTVQAKFARVTQALQNSRAADAQVETVTERHFKKRDMGNFFDGARSQGRGDDE